MCPGMPLAHRVVSLMVASFVYHFDWKLPHAKKEMDMNCIFGITLIRATSLVATPIPAKISVDFVKRASMHLLCYWGKMVSNLKIISCYCVSLK